MEGLIIFLVVGLAVLYIGRSCHRKFKNTGTAGCDCGCSSCAASAACPILGLERLNDNCRITGEEKQMAHRK